MEIDPAGLPKPGLDPSTRLEELASYGKYKGHDNSLGAIRNISKEKKKSQSRRKEQKAFNLSRLSIHLPKPNTSKQTFHAEHKHSSKTKKKMTAKELEYFQKAMGPSHVCLDSTACMHKYFEIAFGKCIKKAIKRRQRKQEQRVEKLLEGMEKLDI